MQPTDYNSLLKDALLRLESLQAELEAERRQSQQARQVYDQLHEPIAVIGMACRLPGGVETPADFWQLLRQGGDTAQEIPPDRWDVNELYDPDPAVPGKMYTRFGSFIENPAAFDAQFFNISPREAMSLDPQQRLLLEVTWEALEAANIVPEKLYNSQTGVFVGISNGEYLSTALKVWKKDVLSNVDPYFGTGNAFSTAAGRISYTLRLVGPNVAVDTACSSSLSAVYLACQSLRTGKSELCLAGGVNMVFTPAVHVIFSKARMLSPDGHCKTFDAAADGYLRGEGCGMLVLKRLSDAQRDGDTVLAVIRGAAMNQDGASSGLTVPSGPSQQAVVRAALADAGVNPAEVSYIEAHGTGTYLGDPIEAGALAEIFGPHHSPDNPLYIGSVKTNIGHLESAAGVSGLLKIILSMQHREIPRNLHFQQLNPNIPWNGLALHVPVEHQPWQVQRRIAGISGFGFGGTNVHVVLEEAPPPTPAAAAPPVETEADARPQVLCLSSRSEQGLRDLAAKYSRFLQSADPADWPSICHTSHHYRSHFRFRLAVVAAGPQEAAGELASYAGGGRPANLFSGQANDAIRPRLAFLFTGQGAQYAGMGRDLYQSEPVFRQWLDRCSELLGPIEGYTLLEVLFPAERRDHLINETLYTQPALFALEYALAQLLLSWGIQAEVMLGHSIGEYAAACLAGVFSLEDGLRLVAARGRLMGGLPHNGRMLTVFAAPETVQAHLQALQHNGTTEALSIAAVNAPENVVVSGASAAVEALAGLLAGHGIRSEALQVSHAFHSPLMEPILEPFRQVAESVAYRQPEKRLVSNLHGGLAIEGDLQSAAYWGEHIRQGVQFMAGMQTMQQHGVNIYLEIGPRPALTGLGRQCLDGSTAVWSATLRPGKSDRLQLAGCLAQLYIAGFDLPWQGFDQRSGVPLRRVALPTYAFQRQRFWMADMNADLAEQVEPHPLLGEALDLADRSTWVFEAEIGPHSPSYLGEHRLFHHTVVPGVAYMEIAIAASRAYFPPDQQLRLLNFRIEQPLILQPNQTCRLQTSLKPRPDGSFELTIHFSHADNRGWQRLLSGVIEAGYFNLPANAPTLAELYQPESGWQLPGRPGPSLGAFYQRLSLQGYEYGPSFLTLKEMHFSGAPGELVCCVRVRLDNPAQAAHHTFHPGLLDGILQPLAFSAPKPSLMPLPIAFHQMTFHAPPTEAAAAELLGYIRVSGSAAEIYAYHTDGRLVISGQGELLQIERLGLFRLLQPNFNDWFYHLEWAALTEEAESAPARSAANQWLLCADAGGVAEGLAQRLLGLGDQVMLVRPGAPGSGRQSSRDQAGNIRLETLDPLDPQSWRELVREIRPLKGIVHCWNLDVRTGLEDSTDIQSLQQDSLAGLLHLLQAASLEYGVRTPRLWIVTQGAWQTTPNQVRSQPFQALAWGLARSLANELTEFEPVALDLDPDAAQPDQAIEFLLRRLQNRTSSENLLAQRGELGYGLRFQPGWPDYAARLPSGPYRLGIHEYGLLENLHLEAMTRTPPGPDEVEIEVRAAGLNLRDVLNALGLLRQFMLKLGIETAQELPFGGECSGVITAVGENAAAHFQVGDEVIAGLASGTLASHVRARFEALVYKPPQLSFVEAATLPTAGLTAFYGLHTLAHIRPGDRVLIHAAAGGVGQAALQVARWAGAEVFATASPAKWDFLRAQGIEHIYNSRNLDFQQQLLADTAGEGVQIVLNSLAGEFIPASLAVLAQGGRFVELGKLGILTAEEFQQQRPDATYHAFDLILDAIRQPEIMRSVLNEIEVHWRSGAFQPLPCRTFPLTEAVEAFRFMAQARHIGKIVLVQPPPPVAIRPDATYLISGGLGGLGLQIAGWLVYQGARRLLLVGRSGAAGPAAQTALAELQALGAEIQAVACDVADPAAVAALVAGIQAGPAPLAGVIHAAGVNQIAPLRHYPWPDFVNHLQPKVAGAWNLHRATLGLALDFFVCFSSMSALTPTAGQASYSASNLFMDALMQARKAAGLPGTSINWGPWGQVGMVTRLEAHLQQGQLAAGLQPFSNAAGRMAFEAVMNQVFAPAPHDRHSPAPGLGQVYLFDMDWQKFATFAPAAAGSPALAAVAQVQASGKRQRGELLEQLKALPPDERKPFLFKTVQGELAGILNLPAVGIERHQRLLDFGMDSLMAIEFKNSLEISLACNLPATMVFDYPTVGEVTDFLVDEMLGLGAAAAPTAPQKRKPAGLLATLQPGGAGRPLFFIHPIGGQVLCYQPLADLLGSGQPFYALQAAGADGAAEPLASIPLMAERYLEEIQTVQAQGPYRLGGWSLGGLVAYEMARLLAERGEETELLALVDSHLPGPDELKHLKHVQALSAQEELQWLLDFAADLGGSAGVELAIPKEHLEPWPRPEQLHKIWQAGRETGALPSGAPYESLVVQWRLYRSHRLALTDYWLALPDLPAYPGPAWLYSAESPYRGAGGRANAGQRQRWQRRIGGNLHHSLLPGDHYSILQADGLKQLAASLQTLLETPAAPAPA